MWRLLNPIANWIDLVEADNPAPFLSIVPKAFADIQDKFEKYLPVSPLTKAEETTVLKKLNARKEFCVTTIHHVAVLLDPNETNLKATMPKDLIVTATSHLHDFALQLGLNGQDVMEELGKFKTKTDGYNVHFKSKLTALIWWKSIADVSGDLGVLAQAIFSMPCTTASTERSFSTYAAVHSKTKNRLSVTKAGKLVYISHNLRMKGQPRSRKFPSDEELDPEEDNDGTSGELDDPASSDTESDHYEDFNKEPGIDSESDDGDNQMEDGPEQEYDQ
jgi:hypothetical protein